MFTDDGLVDGPTRASVGGVGVPGPYEGAGSRAGGKGSGGPPMNRCNPSFGGGGA